MIERYYLKADHEWEWSNVTRKQFIAAEQAAGFRSKFGPDHPATGGFTGKGMRGRVEYIIDDNDNDAPAAPERGERWQRKDNEVFIHRNMTETELTAARAKGFKTTDIRYTVARFYGEDGEENAQRTIDAVNQHSTLIAQRERLLTVLRQIRNAAQVFADSKYLETAQVGLRQIVIDIDEVVTTSEQEGR